MIDREHELQEFERWFANNGRARATSFPFLTNKSIVWEVGLYKGDWVRAITQKYDPYVLVFEPVEEWAEKGRLDFLDNHKVCIFDFGLSDKSEFVNFGISEDASGVHCNSNVRTARMESVVSFLERNFCKNVDLLHLNCEGGEYSILPALIDSGDIARFNFLAVQFHQIKEEHPAMRVQIQNQLQKTHKHVLCYDWVWEYWEKRNA